NASMALLADSSSSENLFTVELSPKAINSSARSIPTNAGIRSYVPARSATRCAMRPPHEGMLMNLDSAMRGRSFRPGEQAHRLEPVAPVSPPLLVIDEMGATRGDALAI